MRIALIWLVIGLGVMGCNLLLTAASPSVVLPEAAREAALIGGVACLALATGLLAYGIRMFGRDGGPPRGGAA